MVVNAPQQEQVLSRIREEFSGSRTWELGTITGRGFSGRRIWKQGIIRKQEEVNIRTQVGGLGCAIRGDVEAHQKIRKSIQEEVNIKKKTRKAGGRVARKNIANKTDLIELEDVANRGAKSDLQGQFTQGSLQWM